MKLVSNPVSVFHLPSIEQAEQFVEHVHKTAPGVSVAMYPNAEAGACAEWEMMTKEVGVKLLPYPDPESLKTVAPPIVVHVGRHEGEATLERAVATFGGKWIGT